MYQIGMSDAACRMLSNSKITSGYVVGSGLPLPQPEKLSAASADIALQNIEYCVVGLLERFGFKLNKISIWFLSIRFDI